MRPSATLVIAMRLRRQLAPAIVALVVGLAASCCEQPRHVGRAMYYWRSTFEMTPADTAYLTSLDVDRLYVRFFDVDRSGGRAPAPISVVRFLTRPPNGVEIVPTVYITQSAIVGAMGDEEVGLGERIARKIVEMVDAFELRDIREVQLDCDWTRSTRGTYFTLIRQVESYLRARGKPWTVSSTIRLHQIADRELAGVPPVSRGMLMAYNAGRLTDLAEANSIIRSAEVERYLGRLGSYPVPLDVALPIFSWGVVFRGSKLATIVHDVTTVEIRSDHRFEHLGGARFRALEDLYLHNIPISKDDEVRIEESAYDETRAAAGAIASRLGSDSLHVALYHFAPSTADRHEPQALESLYRAFR
jgi:hypothetical protein